MQLLAISQSESSNNKLSEIIRRVSYFTKLSAIPQTSLESQLLAHRLHYNFVVLVFFDVADVVFRRNSNSNLDYSLHIFAWNAC